MNTLSLPPRIDDSHHTVNKIHHTEMIEGWGGAHYAVLKMTDEGWIFCRSEEVEYSVYKVALHFFKLENKVNLAPPRPVSKRSYGLMSVIEDRT